MARSGSDKPSLLRSPPICSLQEEKAEEGLVVGEDGGEEGREEQPRGSGEPKSSLTSLSLMRLNRDFTGEGRAGGLCASGSVLPSASGPGRQYSQPAVRPLGHISYCQDELLADFSADNTMKEVLQI